MINTDSFPNTINSAPNEDIKRNCISKEDLEGGIKKNVSTYFQNINGGNCQYVQL